MNKNNFFLASEGLFTLCEQPHRSPDYISYFNGEPSSYYWFEESRLVRCSNHWFNVAQCYWKLDGVVCMTSELGAAMVSTVNGVVTEVTASVLWADLQWRPKGDVDFSKIWSMCSSNTELLKEILEQYSY